MERFIVVNLQVEGTHQWSGCPIIDVKFLRDLHRHVFHIKIVKKVTHSDRDVEIIMFKRNVIEHLRTNYGSPANFGESSCEMIAERLLSTFECEEVQVLEDGENGGLIRRKK